ncbi:MAG: diaminopimelate epimerase [Chitinophagaceae bacterium]|nr:diaminopimelate epimerase [Chitinophagaceae bacterium]MBL0306325.1 diaminopimelate epimerase [Chitinophagaceae bacterium]HQV86292.1 diaminopimelate epimerase [Chitinophagaceae bacterium]HQX73432.1 diaminopimelate epimerase [Chitinophagaceae bacterium]HQZ73195.1 diaminopimelate epimerase [Chitinophagaceae bacterium]
MQFHFYKYQGTGNDFIIADNRKNEYSSLTTGQIHHLCDRRFGIGADGLMLLNEKEGYDFEMKYYNADGKEGTMCGNGGRCITKFAYHLGIHREVYHFLAADGPHEAEIDMNGIVSLKMKNVDVIKKFQGDLVLNTGSPHYIKMVRNVMDIDVYKKGHDIRYSREFSEEGINVNFVEQTENPNKIIVRTYERGVEDETYSCGTGVTAAALVSYHNENGFNDIEVKTLGGTLTVEFDRFDDERYENIWLCGPAEKVYEGAIEIK